MGPPREVAAVRRAVRRALADLPPRSQVLVACSGGFDSIALALAVAVEAPRARLRAGAVTVDHGLQDGSADRAGQVAQQLTDLNLDPVEIVRVQVTGHGGPEAAARTARYAALDACAVRLGAVAVLLGHTRDDQAETVLLGLARGSGARSLSGMRPVRDRLRRPLLGLDREVVRRSAAGHRTWDDPHNDDHRFTRVRVRREVLPALEASLGPGVVAALARTADLLRADADALDAWAASSYSEVLVTADDVTVGLDVTALATLPTAVRTRVLRRAAIAAGAPSTDLGAVHVGELDRLVTDWHGQGPLQLPGGVEGARACGTLALTRPGHGRR